MWEEKSHFYHDNKPEAIAQSQKGINEMMDLRDGQRTQGLQPAPLKPETAKAMEVIAEAPTGMGATAEAMQDVDNRIGAIRDSNGNQVYRNTEDAMSKIGRSVEYNKWTRSAVTSGDSGGMTASETSSGSATVSQSSGTLNGRQASRIARLNEEREWARQLREQQERGMTND